MNELYYQLAFPKRITFKASEEGSKRAKELIAKHNGITAVYRTIYNFDGFPRTENAIIDKLFFDFDHNENNPGEAQEGLRRLHEYLKEKGLKHSMFFSGRGFHLFLFTERKKAREFHNPPIVTRNAHDYICKQAKVRPDPKTRDIVRVARLPNTKNIKTGLYCIGLNEEEIYLPREMIMEKAKAWEPKYKGVEGNLFSLEGFDRTDIEVEYYVPTESLGDAVELHELPKCIAYSLQQGDCGLQERYAIITALRDLCFSKEDTQRILKKYLSPKKYKHCVYSENQIEYLYGRPDLLFPSCSTLKGQGMCIEGCSGQTIYI